MSEVWIARGAVLFSAAVHFAVFSIPTRPARAHESPVQASIVEFSIPAPEPEPVPEPEPEPEPEPRKVQLAAAQPRQAIAPPSNSVSLSEREPTPVAGSSAAESPSELTGNTLVSDLGAEWKAPRGSGAPRRGVFRPGVSRVQQSLHSRASPAVGKAPVQPSGPVVVPLAQLAKRPIPPALGASLEKNYPPSARRQGKSGEAKVRARIEANGQVVIASIREQSSPEFGRACQKTLQGSRWSAPLDEKGRQVATWINYRCKFRFDD